MPLANCNRMDPRGGHVAATPEVRDQEKLMGHLRLQGKVSAITTARPRPASLLWLSIKHQRTLTSALRV